MASIDAITTVNPHPQTSTSATDIMNVDTDTTTQTTTAPTVKRLPITVTKPIPYTFDLGNLLCNDANPLPTSSTGITEDDLRSTARDCAQALLNQLLSTCPIARSADNTSMTITLPPTTTPLPREKPVPQDKPLTKWQEFAKKKGITGKEKTGKMVYDEAKGEWVPKWGYKGKNKDGMDDWLVEVDEKKEAARGEADDARREKRADRKERIRRQERKMRSNEKRGAK